MYAVPLPISLNAPLTEGRRDCLLPATRVRSPCSRVHFAAVTQKALTADDAFSLLSDGAGTSPDLCMYILIVYRKFKNVQ